MRVFQQYFRDRRTGKSRQTNSYYVEFNDGTGQRRRMPALRSKAQSEEFGRKVQRLADCRAARMPPDAELVRWVESLSPDVHRRLLRYDLLDARLVGSVRPMDEHLKDFEAALGAKENTPAYVELVVTRVRRVADGCGFRFWSDISASRLQAFLAGLRRGGPGARGISAQTSNFYLRSFNQFCRWMHADGRAGESPVRHLHGLNVQADRRHDRRPLEVEELMWLLDATERGPERAGVAGADRALLYRLAVETGLRAGELASLTVSSFSLDTDPPTVTVLAAHSKRRTEDLLVLKRSTAELLQGHLMGRPPAAPALTVLPKDSRTHVLRANLTAARSAWLASAPDAVTKAKMAATDFLLYRDQAGRYADFHAFRHATGSFLAQGGVSPKVAQTIMRHSDINLTMSTYSHAYREDEARAVERLPDLGRRPPAK